MGCLCLKLMVGTIEGRASVRMTVTMRIKMRHLRIPARISQDEQLLPKTKTGPYERRMGRLLQLRFWRKFSGR